MPNSALRTPEPSVPERLRSIYEQGQVFVKAELELLKLESKSVLNRVAVALIVLTGSGLLLAIALSLVAAAVVLMQGGSAAAALLTAAGVDFLVAIVSTVSVIVIARKRVEKAASSAASATQITNLPQHGSPVS